MQLLQGDCLEVMKSIPDKSVDMILADLPYGTTACKWDVVIPFEPLWEQYNRVIKDRGCVALFGSEPFSSYLRMSNIKKYKYDWVWNKGKGSNPFLAKKQPMRSYELISIFNSKIYYPQMRPGKPYKAPRTGGCRTNSIVGATKDKEGFQQKDNDGWYYPLAILDYSIHCGSKVHPTQKPVALLEYLIRAYTLEGETVLDNVMGSGSTGVACVNTNRDFIGIELDQHYYEVACKRIAEAEAVKNRSNKLI